MKIVSLLDANKVAEARCDNDVVQKLTSVLVERSVLEIWRRGRGDEVIKVGTIDYV